MSKIEKLLSGLTIGVVTGAVASSAAYINNPGNIAYFYLTGFFIISGVVLSDLLVYNSTRLEDSNSLKSDASINNLNNNY